MARLIKRTDFGDFIGSKKIVKVTYSKVKTEKPYKMYWEERPVRYDTYGNRYEYLKGKWTFKA